MSFEQFNLPSSILAALDEMKISEPTAIQASSIPLAMESHDLLASAQTGSGKTLAYLIPVLTKLLEAKDRRALVLLPTRELAMQVKDSLFKLTAHLKGFRSCVLIGGESIFKQKTMLSRNARVVIATPGRLCDHLERKNLSLENFDLFVLDEFDRMLEVGFSQELKKIATQLPEERQTLMFSATLPPKMESLANQYVKNPKRICIGDPSQVSADIEQKIIHVGKNEKLEVLVKELEQREGSVIVFVKTKANADMLADDLRSYEQYALAIHGDLQQRTRQRVIADFRRQKSRILVATDIAARGLDVPHVQHVINYDFPWSLEDYIHRIGRTGRAGVKGYALTMIANEDKHRSKFLREYIDPELKNKPSEFPFKNGRGGGFNRSSRGPGGQGRGPGSRGPRFSESRGQRFGFGEPRTQEGRSFEPRMQEGRSFEPRFSEGGFSEQRAPRNRSFESQGSESRGSRFSESRGSGFGFKKSFGKRQSRG